MSSFEVFSGGFILQCGQSIALEKLLEKKIEQIDYQEENDEVRKFMCDDLIEYVIFSLFQLKKS